MLGKPPRDPKEIGSFAELRECYKKLWSLYDDSRQQHAAAEGVLKSRSAQVRGAKAEAKEARAKIETITRHQAQQEKLVSCASWSGCALGINTLLFQTLRYYDDRHAIPEYIVDSDFVFAGSAWLLTSLFAAAANSFYND
tara:strand:+ start:1589 stop:2008 length:420 start_codon:yes stop_codon:yes gene_type:complete